MPFRYKIIHEKNITFVKAFGEIDLASSIQAMLEVVSNEEHKPEYKAVVDLSETDYDPSMTEMFSLRDSISSLRERVNNEVIVITRTKLLNKINMIAFLTKVYNMKMKAVDHYEGLEELESYLEPLPDDQKTSH